MLLQDRHPFFQLNYSILVYESSVLVYCESFSCWFISWACSNEYVCALTRALLINSGVSPALVLDYWLVFNITPCCLTFSAGQNWRHWAFIEIIQIQVNFKSNLHKWNVGYLIITYVERVIPLNCQIQLYQRFAGPCVLGKEGLWSYEAAYSIMLEI